MSSYSLPISLKRFAANLKASSLGMFLERNSEMTSWKAICRPVFCTYMRNFSALRVSSSYLEFFLLLLLLSVDAVVLQDILPDVVGRDIIEAIFDVRAVHVVVLTHVQFLALVQVLRRGSLLGPRRRGLRGWRVFSCFGVSLRWHFCLITE